MAALVGADVDRWSTAESVGGDLDIYSNAATSVGADLGRWDWSGHIPFDRSFLSLVMIQSERHNAYTRVDSYLPSMLRSELPRSDTLLEIYLDVIRESEQAC